MSRGAGSGGAGGVEKGPTEGRVRGGGNGTGGGSYTTGGGGKNDRLPKTRVPMRYRRSAGEITEDTGAKIIFQPRI